MGSVEVKLKSKATPKTLRELRGRAVSHSAGSVEARYDAAQTTDSNQRHWAAADSLSATAANSEQVRKVLRERSRYEISNNCYAFGMIETMVDDIIGTGPRPQVGRKGAQRSSTDEAVDREFSRFLKRIEIDEKSRIMVRSDKSSGEVFGIMSRSVMRRAGATIFDDVDVELGFHLVEADQIASPDAIGSDMTSTVSGIRYDQYGNPVAYHLLNEHPGDLNGVGYGVESGRWIPAEMVVHYFTPIRPGDARGVPALTPALELLPMLRRYDLAALESAEHLANIAGMLKTDGSIDGDNDEFEPLDTVDIQRGEIMVLPGGYDYVQAQSQQPSSTHPDFVKMILRQIARALGIPYNVAAGDSSGFNYASGRLDHLGYKTKVRVQQARFVAKVLEPLFRAWFAEASRVSNLLPQEARTNEYRKSVECRWFFDGSGHVDPVKEAQGEEIRLTNGTTTYAEVCAKNGSDWRDVMRQRAEEQKFADGIGLKLGSAVPAAEQTSSEENQGANTEEDQS